MGNRERKLSMEERDRQGGEREREEGRKGVYGSKWKREGDEEIKVESGRDIMKRDNCGSSYVLSLLTLSSFEPIFLFRLLSFPYYASSWIPFCFSLSCHAPSPCSHSLRRTFLAYFDLFCFSYYFQNFFHIHYFPPLIFSLLSCIILIYCSRLNVFPLFFSDPLTSCRQVTRANLSLLQQVFCPLSCKLRLVGDGWLRTRSVVRVQWSQLRRSALSKCLENISLFRKYLSDVKFFFESEVL